MKKRIPTTQPTQQLARDQLANVRGGKLTPDKSEANADTIK